MKFLTKDIKLAIFDLDGTLINSTSLWSDIDKTFFSKRNMDIPKGYAKDIAHVGLKEAARITKEKYLPDESEAEILNEWLGYAKKAYQEDITLKSHAYELLELLKSHNVHIALATANAEELYLPCIKRLNIDKYFTYVIDPKSVKGGKSTTEIYDKVKDFYHVKEDETIIFEDLLEPIKVASSKYLVVGVYDPHSIKNIEENKKLASIFIDDFLEVIDIINKEN